MIIGGKIIGGRDFRFKKLSAEALCALSFETQVLHN